MIKKIKAARRKRCKHCGELPAKKCDNFSSCKQESAIHIFDPYTEELTGKQVCVDYCTKCSTASCEDV